MTSPLTSLSCCISDSLAIKCLWASPYRIFIKGWATSIEQATYRCTLALRGRRFQHVMASTLAWRQHHRSIPLRREVVKPSCRARRPVRRMLSRVGETFSLSDHDSWQWSGNRKVVKLCALSWCRLLFKLYWLKQPNNRSLMSLLTGRYTDDLQLSR